MLEIETIKHFQITKVFNLTRNQEVGEVKIEYVIQL